MNNNFTPEKIVKLADLLLIGLTEEEKKMISDEFELIDTQINKINEIDGIESVKPMTHCLDDFACELRDDEAKDSVPLEELLQNCDDTDDGAVSVPKVVG